MNYSEPAKSHKEKRISTPFPSRIVPESDSILHTSLSGSGLENMQGLDTFSGDSGDLNYNPKRLSFGQVLLASPIPHQTLEEPQTNLDSVPMEVEKGSEVEELDDISDSVRQGSMKRKLEDAPIEVSIHHSAKKLLISSNQKKQREDLVVSFSIPESPVIIGRPVLKRKVRYYCYCIMLISTGAPNKRFL